MKSLLSRHKLRLIAGVAVLILVIAAFLNDRTDYGFVSGEEARQRLDSYKWHEEPQKIRLVGDPHDAYLTRRSWIGEAERKIDLATFLWRDDASSRVLFDDLLEACERGVEVRILADGIFYLRKTARVKAMAQAHENLEIRVFNPLGDRLASLDAQSLDDFGWQLDNANHRFHIKLFTIDDKKTLLGGRNIGDPYFGFADDYNFIDMEVAIQGSVVEQAETIFQEFWDSPLTVPVLELKDVGAATAEPRSGPDPIPERYAKGPVEEEWREVNRMAIWADSPQTIDDVSGYQPELLADRLAALLGTVEKDLLVSTPYLVFSERSHALLRRLRSEKEGLQVRFLSNSLAASDNWQTYSAFQAQLRSMITEYRLLIHLKKPSSLMEWAGSNKGFACLHAKVWVADDRWSTIGSFNWDPRSEIFNSEVMAVFDDPGLSAELREILEPLQKPDNAWVVAERELPIGLEQIDGLTHLFNDLSSELTGIRTWSLRNTACFEFVGEEVMSPYEEGFHQHYRSVGSFPNTGISEKKRIYSVLMEPLSELLKPAL